MPTSEPLTKRYRGGSLDGAVRRSTDDQVPQHVAVITPLEDGGAIWEPYSIVERRYDDGLLVECVYELDPPA